MDHATSYAELEAKGSKVAVADHPGYLTRQDARALLALAALFAAMLIGSWQRWTQPIVDHGREMNLPARILAGEILYKDVQCLYGPFAPHFNATLYSIFGTHLSTLHTSGLICALLILLMIYWLARQLMGRWEALLAAGFVLVICAIKSTANYVSPYAFAALYGLVFALGSLVCTVRYLRGNRVHWIFWSGLCAGLALISKPEATIAAMAAAAIALLLHGLSIRKIPWRETAMFALPVVVITAATYTIILSRVRWRTLIEDNHVLFTNMPPQLIYFNRYVSGLADWPQSLWYTVTGLCVFAIWVGVSALTGGLISRRQHVERAERAERAEWKEAAKSGLWAIISGAVLWILLIRLFRVRTDASPLTSIPLILPAMIAAIGWQFWRHWQKEEAIPQTGSLLLVFAVFAQCSIMRSILNVRSSGPYTPFFIPVAIIVCLYLIFRALPGYIISSEEARIYARRTAMVLVGMMIVGVAINSIYRFRSRNTFEIGTPRGGFITEPPIGQPLAAAISYAREHTSPEDYLLTLPQATSINFLSERRYPFMEEIIHPGFVAGAREEAAIETIKSKRIPLIMVVNLLTPEFRDRVFGVDYNRHLMNWIESNYRLVARFDSDYSRNARMGDQPFFILAYERK
jgi:4-amino-4-deoxy-L-arabinose transferase-like glycosyltransferase